VWENDGPGLVISEEGETELLVGGVFMVSSATLAKPAASDSFAPEEPLYEIVNGQRVELPPTSAYAARIASLILFPLHLFIEPKRLGWAVMEMVFVLDPVRDTRRRPDVAFVSAERWPLEKLIPEVGDWEVVPDLAVEVASPNDTLEELVKKVKEYFRCGVRLVWVVLPIQREVYVYESPTNPRVVTEDRELDGGAVLPNFRLPLATLFQPRAETTIA
jgi:Uma2 family endonuclease